MGQSVDTLSVSVPEASELDLEARLIGMMRTWSDEVMKIKETVLCHSFSRRLFRTESGGGLEWAFLKHLRASNELAPT